MNALAQLLLLISSLQAQPTLGVQAAPGEYRWDLDGGILQKARCWYLSDERVLCLSETMDTHHHVFVKQRMFTLAKESAK